MELAIECLVGRALWESTFLVNFLVLLEFFKVKEAERTLGDEGLLTL